MARPNRKTYRELPVSVVRDWDTAWIVRRALDELERGMFKAAAHLSDSMGRDGRIQGALAQRLSALSSLPLEVQAASDDSEPQQVADEVKKLWPRILPGEIDSRLRKWAVMLGIGIAQKVWDTRDGQWVPTLRPLHPSFYWWRWDTRSIWVNMLEGPVEVPEGGDEHWFVYTPHGYYLAWLEGAIRALAIPWLMRAWARRDWARYNELYGLGLIKAIIPAGASRSPDASTSDPKDRFVSNLANRGSEPVIECEQDENGRGYDFELVESKGTTGWESFPQQIGNIDAEIAITLLGQNLTSEGGRGGKGGGGGGAYALGKVHEAVKAEIIRADNESFSQALQEQLLREYCLYNHGDPDLAPLPTRNCEPAEDKSQTATALSALGDALTKFQTASAPVDVRELLDQQGVPLTDPEDEDDDPEGGNEPPEPPPEPDEPAKLHRLGAGAEDDLPSGSRRGLQYSDELAAQAAKLGARELQADLAEVMKAIREATSPDDLRARLVKLAEGSDSPAFAKLVEQAHVLAELAGRQSVLEDVGS